MSKINLLTSGKPITLEEIANRKEELRLEIEKQREEIVGSAKNLFSPISSGITPRSLMRSMNAGMAIFDGVLLGLKIMRKLKQFFNKR
ncbi:MAG: hypothetical protein RSA44_00720 [Bacteroides sp.]